MGDGVVGFVAAGRCCSKAVQLALAPDGEPVEFVVPPERLEAAHRLAKKEERVRFYQAKAQGLMEDFAPLAIDVWITDVHVDEPDVGAL